MKKRFKSLATLCVFGFSLLSSALTVEAIDEFVYTVSSTEMCIDESNYLPDETVVMSEYLPFVDYQYNEGTFSFYDQLDDNNKAAYDVLKAWAEPTEEEFTISLPDTISFATETTDTSQWSEEESSEFWNMIFSNIQYGKDALILDYPEIFWLDMSKITLAISDIRTSYNPLSKMYTMKISKIGVKGCVREEYTDLETAKEYKQLLDYSVENFEVDGDDRYQQVKYIHDYIAKAVTYSTDGPYHYASIGLFCEPYQLVCEGYSKAFKLICDSIDIPCITVPGNINVSDNTGHMWNYVMMEDGEWYGIDCTWDDLNNASNPIKYSYFLKGSDSFCSNHTADSQYYTLFEYPELNTADYVYESSEPIVTTVPETEPVTTTTETTITTTVPVTTEVTTTEPVTTVTTTVPATEPMTTTETTTVTTERVTTTTEPVVTTIETTLVTTSSTETVTTTVPVTTQIIVTTTIPVPEHVEGDYNCDGIVNIADIVELKKVLLGIEVMDESFPDDDLNEDNTLNVFDCIILSRRILGGI